MQDIPCVLQKHETLTNYHYRDGTRVVVKDFGESWTKYVIVPRDLALRTLKRAQELGCGEHILDACPMGHLHSERYSGPGRPFTRMPWKLTKPRLRRFLVFVQSGGWDV